MCGAKRKKQSWLSFALAFQLWLHHTTRKNGKLYFPRIYEVYTRSKPLSDRRTP